MALESKMLGNFCARSGNHFQLGSQFSFASANSGQNLWLCKGLPLLLRRVDTKLRAERVTRRRPGGGSDNWERMDREEYRGVEDPSILDAIDANAENVRRRRSKRMSYSRPEVDDEPSPPMTQRNNRFENSWWDSQRNDRYRNSEWDYESEPPRAETKSSKGREWWLTDDGDDTYEEDEDDEEEDDWRSWLNVDVKDAFMVLRWVLPAAFLLCTAVIPVMIGNPLMLLFGFSIVPTVVKALNPVVKDFFRSAANPFASPSSDPSKMRNERASAYSRRSKDESNYSDRANYYDAPNYSSVANYSDTANYPDLASPPQPISAIPDSDVSRQKVPIQRNSLGGWDDLVEDRYRIQAESRRPLQRRGRPGKKLAKIEQPLVIRIILAFFPFLRRWVRLF